MALCLPIMEGIQQPKYKNSISMLLVSEVIQTDKDSSYGLQVNVEGLDKQESISSHRLTLLVELVLQKALGLLIAVSIQKPLMFIYMVTIASNPIHSTRVPSD